MKNNFLLIVLTGCVILFSSCGKEESIDPEINSNRVKTYTENIVAPGYSNSVIFNLGYDDSKRLISMTVANSPGDKFLFNYSSDNHYSMDLYASGSVEIHEEFFLKNSFMDSTVQFTVSQDTMAEKYFYNAANQPIKKLEFEYNNGPHLINTISYTFDANGNMVQSSDTDGNVDTYEYYPDLAYVMPKLAPFYPSVKQNLVKTHTITSNGYPVGKTESTYTFDSQNRISSIKEVTDDGIEGTKTFSYF